MIDGAQTLYEAILYGLHIAERQRGVVVKPLGDLIVDYGIYKSGYSLGSIILERPGSGLDGSAIISTEVSRDCGLGPG